MIHFFHHLRHCDQVVSALLLEEALQGEIVFLKDDYSFFSWRRNEEGWFAERKHIFDQLNAYITPSPPPSGEPTIYPFARDKHTLDGIVKRLEENSEESVCFWFTQNASEVSMYLYALRYFEAFKGQIYTVNIDNLPFFTEEKRIFFPHQMSQINPNELRKCVGLVHQLSEAEIEMDIDMANSLVGVEAVRVLDGTKRLKPATFEQTIDEKILLFLQQQKRSRKIDRLLQHLEQQYSTDLSPLVAWRLQLMMDSGVVRKGEAPAKTWSEQDIILSSKIDIPTTA